MISKLFDHQLHSRVRRLRQRGRVPESVRSIVLVAIVFAVRLLECFESSGGPRTWLARFRHRSCRFKNRCIGGMLVQWIEIGIGLDQGEVAEPSLHTCDESIRSEVEFSKLGERARIVVEKNGVSRVRLQ